MSTAREQWTRALAHVGAARSKFGARKKVVDGVTFDSTKEANHYQQLRLRELAGEIKELERQPKFPLYVQSRSGTQVMVSTYVADFRYREGPNGILRVEDVKSVATRTPLYKLKKKMVETIYGITIYEV